MFSLWGASVVSILCFGIYRSRNKDNGRSICFYMYCSCEKLIKIPSAITINVPEQQYLGRFIFRKCRVILFSIKYTILLDKAQCLHGITTRIQECTYCVYKRYTVSSWMLYLRMLDVKAIQDTIRQWFYILNLTLISQICSTSVNLLRMCKFESIWNY